MRSESIQGQFAVCTHFSHSRCQLFESKRFSDYGVDDRRAPIWMSGESLTLTVIVIEMRSSLTDDNFTSVRIERSSEFPSAATCFRFCVDLVAATTLDLNGVVLVFDETDSISVNWEESSIGSDEQIVCRRETITVSGKIWYIL